MSTRTNETEPGFSFSDATKAKAPIKVWLTIGAALMAGAVAWTSQRGDTAEHTRRITELEQVQRTLATEQRAQRDILIRIDANVSALKERK